MGFMPGLRFWCVAKTIFKEVWVVAPETEQSATSHSLTLRLPLRIRRIKKYQYAVDGTRRIVCFWNSRSDEDLSPDIVLSGIIAEGTSVRILPTWDGCRSYRGNLLGFPVALSQYCEDQQQVSEDRRKMDGASF